MRRTLVNVAIVLLLAAGVVFLPGGGAGADVFGAVLSIAFLGVLVWFAARTYREQRMTLYALGDRWRGILYGAIGVAVLTIAATGRLWETGPGVVVWFALLAGAVYALVLTWRHSRSY
jgi:hypothetical protein